MSYPENLSAPVGAETRLERLLRTGAGAPRFLQGVFPFAGRGLFDLAPLDDSLVYTVPAGRVAQLVYFRAGNHSDDLIYVVFAANGEPVRYFPIGPKADVHVPLAIVETQPTGTRMEILYAAPRGLSGTLIVDAGLVEFTPEGGTV